MKFSNICNICMAIFAGILMLGCLGNGGSISQNLAVNTEPSPINLNIGPNGGANAAFVTLRNNNPYPIRVQCIPPRGVNEAGLQEQLDGTINRTLLARPGFSCTDTDEMANSSRAVYPIVTIRPNEAHSFYLKSFQYGLIRLQTTDEEFKTVPGTYDLDLTLEVSCGMSIYCMSRHENVTIPIRVTVQSEDAEAMQ
jgi:hypothetical protein